jgi:hypothetical protein
MGEGKPAARLRKREIGTGRRYGGYFAGDERRTKKKNLNACARQ